MLTTRASVSYFGGGLTTDAGVKEVSYGPSGSGSVDWDGHGLNLEGQYHNGLTIEDAHNNFDIGDGAIKNETEVGEISTGPKFEGGGTINSDGVHLHGDGAWSEEGGIDVKNFNNHLSVGDGAFTNDTHVGSFSNMEEVKGATLDIDGNGISAGVKEGRFGGMDIKDVSTQGNLYGTNYNASMGEFSNDTVINDAHASITQNGIDASVGHVETGGIDIKNVQAGFANEEYDVGGHVSMGEFAQKNTLDGGRFHYGNDGIDAHADKIGYDGWDINKVAFDGHAGALHGSGSLDKFGMNEFNAEDANVSLNGDGFNASVKKANFSEFSGQNLNLDGGIDGVYDSHLHVGDGHFNEFSGEDMHTSLNGDGLSVGGKNLHYSYLGFNDVDSRQSIGDGAVGDHIHMGHGDLFGGNAGSVELNSTGRNTDLEIKDLNAHGLQLTDTDVGANIGDLNADIGAKQLNVLDAHVGDVQAHVQDYGLGANASVDDANVDLVNIKGGHAGIGWGDQNLVSVGGDYRANAGVDHADANYSLMDGTASADVQNAHFGQQLDNASIGLGGYNIDLPSMGYNANVSAGANLNLSEGEARAHASLAGSSVNFAGYDLELGDWAQASAGMNLSEGEFDANIGGEDGLGAMVNLSEGQFDFSLGGYHLNNESVAEGWDATTGAIGDAASWVGDGISSIGSGIASAFSGW